MVIFVNCSLIVSDYLGAINAGASALFLQRDPALSAPLGTNIIRTLDELYI